MSTLRVQRILCDNPDCVVSVDELVREEPGEFELVEHVVQIGWTQVGDTHYCPDHGDDVDGAGG
jgi:hypothetical protein